MKARLFLFSVLAFGSLAAFGQADSTLYVKHFPGADVGHMVSAAMADCNPDARIPCYLVIDASLINSAPGVLPSLCNLCVVIDWRYGGKVTTGPGIPAPGGSVSSVGLSMPPEQVVSGSPLTTGGVLAVSDALENPNAIWAGPATAGAMSIVQTAVTRGNAPGTYGVGSITVALSQPITAGSAVAVFSFESTSGGVVDTVSDNGGDTFTSTAAGGYVLLSYTCAAHGGASSVTVASNDTYLQFVRVVEISGAVSSACLDVSGVHDLMNLNSGSSPAASVVTSASITSGNELLLFESAYGSQYGPSDRAPLVTVQVPFVALDSSMYATDSAGGGWSEVFGVDSSETGLGGLITATVSAPVGPQTLYSDHLGIYGFKLATVPQKAVPRFRSLVRADFPADVLAQFTATAVGTTAHLVNASLCTLTNSTDSSCAGTVTLPITFADSSYALSTQVEAGSGAFVYLTVKSKAAGSFDYMLTCSYGCSAVGSTTADITAWHN